MHKRDEKDTGEMLAGLWKEAEELAEKCDTKAAREKLDETREACARAGAEFDKQRADAVLNRAEITNLVFRLDEESRRITAAAESGKPMKKLVEDFEYIIGRLDAEIKRAEELCADAPAERKELRDYLNASISIAIATRMLDNCDMRILAGIKEKEGAVKPPGGRQGKPDGNKPVANAR